MAFPVSTEVALALFSLVVSFSSAAFAWRAVHQARIANAVAVITGFLGDFRDLEPKRRFIIRELGEFDPSMGISELPDDARSNVVPVLHYLDTLGLVLERGLIDERAVTGYLGPSVLRLWTAVAPFVETERSSRGGEGYQLYSEFLAARIAAIDPTGVHARVRRVTRWPAASS